MKFFEVFVVCCVMVLMVFLPTIFVAQAVVFYGFTFLIMMAVVSTIISVLVVYNIIESHLKK
jgi:hypothetical protein